ncbi:HEAT repeat domain-containing protein [Paraburkholderia sp. D15]|uniref:HEAT repeat domain-containing protein n=1 Tax=Paraburkholderia sp. D15 TaxID=2880218 RepID=UPI00247A399A|nr:HEAT repeat domain-containing protein [Paraburkholderia sp. D15]WGS51673.1 HEAT repeat domain-containing protein [Paraburkholderia sp. D15]
MTHSTLLSHDPDALAPEAAALLPRLADADPVVRRIALLELADLEDPETLPLIAHALAHDASAEVRREAARVLGSWEEPWIADALCHALLDTDDDVRAAAAHSLSALKDAACAPVLRRWADHAEPFVQAAVLRGLRELRHADALEPALHALDHQDDSVRTEAVVLLGWLKDPRALGPLARLVTSDVNADIRRAAVGALGFASASASASASTSTSSPESDTPTIAALLHALHDPVWQVREEAATTLGKLRALTALDALIAALDDDWWQVRLRATRALGVLGERRAALPIAALLTNAISNLRKEAALALGELRDPATLDALNHALNDADPDVRKAVRIALQQIEETTR